jgi:integrase
MKVRVFQVSRDVKRHGRRKADWSIEWHDPGTGKKLSKSIGPKKLADEAADAKRTELVHRTLGLTTETPWPEFVTRYLAQHVETEMTSEQSRVVVRAVLARFTKLMEPKYVSSVDETMLDQYVSKRRKARGRKPDSRIAAATIRKDIRVLLAALGKAKRWKCIRNVPEKPKVKGIETDKRYVTETDFDAMLTALAADKCPVSFPFAGDHGGEWTTAEWWTAFLVVAWVTGMRRGALLALRWQDVNLETGEAVSRGIDNKGRKDTIVKIGAAVGMLTKLKPADTKKCPLVFPWGHALTWLDHELMAIQTAAGIDLPCTSADSHTCTAKCSVYSLHDFRRAHATYNYGKVTDRDLQRQMGHASFQTTRSYAKYAETHRQSPYDPHLSKLAKATAQGLKVASAKPDGGQGADNARLESATA